MPDANAVAISEPAYASLVFERICSVSLVLLALPYMVLFFSIAL